MTDKKIKVLTLSDHPLLPSGVATQTKYVIEALLKTGLQKVTKLKDIIFGTLGPADVFNF